MGYISEHNKSINTNSLDNDIVLKLYVDVRNHCAEIIEQGYQNYLTDSEKIFSEDETTITAGIYDHIQTIVETDDLPFIVIPEFHQYTTAIKKGKVNPNKAKRFDLHFTNFNYKPRIKFGVEAKLLAETNTTSRSATFLTNEYVEDAGMGKFIKGTYEDDGFMLGYILNGTTDTIVVNINLKVTSTYSVKEQLSKSKKHYISTYTLNGKEKELYHIFLNFPKHLN
ncbi:MAG: hypothetical protein KGZ81_09765 [Flavobacteriales bacterium]|nr:hypothetical protein [Flavobacteriales bacterium]